MKYFLSIFFLSFCLNHLSAQEKHFVFIQADNNQPFYVSVNGKLYSSTATGYVIIPKLTDGVYNFSVGFAQNTYPEQSFECVIDKKDLGFNLKNFNDKGWGLFNLQTLEVTMAGATHTNDVAKALDVSNAAKKADEEVISFDKKKKDTIAETKPVEDTVNAQPVAKATETSKDTAGAANLVATEQKPVVEEVPKKEAVGAPRVESDVKKVSETKGDEGVTLSYVEGTGKKADTIQVIIPSSPTASPNAGNTSSSVAAPESKLDASTTNAASTKSSSNEAAPKFLDISMNSGKKDTVTATAKPEETRPVMENSNCKNIATDDDYAKLRKKMALETSDDKMIAEARKFYRNKCFTTSQIKGLSSLFMSDEGRFKFFDASFVSVADAGQYYTLQSELIDPAYVARFKALLQ
jgi:hypothetical protein